MMEHQIKSSFQIDLIRSCVGPGRVWSIFLKFGRFKKNSISETCLFRIPLLGKSPIFTALLLRENHDFPSSGFQNKTSFLFETSQPRISLFECWDESSSDHRGWDESSSDHRDVPDALPLLPCPQDPGQPDYLLLYHSCVFSNFTQTRKVWNKLLSLRGILGYANQKKIWIFSLYEYVKLKEPLAVSAVSATETKVFHLL